MLGADERGGPQGPEFYPEPEPAHVRDTPEGSALQRELVLERDLKEQRDRRRAAEEELESARRLIGSGPFVIVKLQSLNAITDHGAAEVRIGFGGGVTRHMLDAVLRIGQQAVREALPFEAHGEQRDTVRLPDPAAPLPESEHMSPDHNLFRCGHPDCVRDAQSAQEPSEHVDPRDVPPGY